MAAPPPAVAAPPSRRWRRGAARGLGLAGGLVILGGLVVGLRGGGLDPDAYKARIEAAVFRATGRSLTIGGHLRIGLFNGPRIKATNVTLSNAPGGSRPQMVTVAEVKARLALLPLLAGRIEIERLELTRPDILLEIDPNGQPNWRFTPPPRAPAGGPEPSAGASRPHQRIIVRDLRMTDGAAMLLDDRTGQRIALSLKTVTATQPADADPLTFGVTAAVGDTDMKLAGTVGRDTGAPKAWPVKLELSALGALATLTGTVDAGLLAPTTADPAGPGRYDLSLTASVQNLADLAPLLPGVTPPPVKDLHLKLAVAGARGGLPELRQLDLSAGHSDLTGLVPGLVVDQVSIVDASAEASLQARAAGSYGGADFKLSADLGAPAALKPGAPEPGPFPIAFSASGAGARLTAKGGILHPRTLQGLDLAVEAQVPDVGAFAALLHRALPALKDLTGRARITDGADGLRRGVTLSGLHVTTPGTDATADLALDWAPRPAVSGHIAAASLNAGDLVSAFANPINPPPVLSAPAAPAATGASPPPTAPAAPRGARHLLSDRPIRFDRWLAGTDADLRLDAATVTWPDEVWRNLSGHLQLAAGTLRLNPIAADLPAGHAQATLAIDTTRPVPAVALTVRAPGVSVRPLLALLGLPEIATGRLEVDANLHGAGRSPHEIAAGIDGSLGLAMVGGSVDGGAAQTWLAELLRRAALPDGARLSGRTQIDCLALRLDLTRGLGTLRAAALQTPLLSLTGSGGVNLAEETVAMQVRALASVGIGIAVPFDVSGPLRAPVVRVNIAGGATSALEGAAGLVIGRLDGDHGSAGLGGPTCASELATARGGWEGKLPTITAAPARPAPPPSRPAERAARVFRWLLP